MTDERLGRTAGAWLHDTDEPAPDPQGIVRAAMTRVPQVHQAHASGLRARLEREEVPVPGVLHPATDHHIHKGGYSMSESLRFVMAAVVLLITGGLLFAVVSPPSTDEAVAPVPATSSASPQPTASTAPTASPMLTTTGSANDGVFELTITTPRTTWMADEPIEAHATFAYVGEAPPSDYRGAGVVFEIEQLDGPIDSGWGRNTPCPGDVYTRGQVRTFPYQKSDGDPQAGDAAFWRSWLKDPELRLPAGTYRIVAHGLYASRECRDAAEPEAAVMIKVVEPTDTTPEASESPSDAVIKVTDTKDGVRITAKLDGPLVAGEPAQVTTRVKNTGDQPIWWHSDIAVGASMPVAR